jgi:hypothetical protein
VRITLGEGGQIIAHDGATCDVCGQHIRPDEQIIVRGQTDVEQVNVAGWWGLPSGTYTVATPQPPMVQHYYCSPRAAAGGEGG